MIAKMVFIADDGRMFDSIETYKRYENQLFDTVRKFIHIKNKDGDEAFFFDINSLTNALMSTQNLFLTIDHGIPNDTLKLFNSCLNKFSDSTVTKSGEYRWDWDNDQWISYDDDYATFCEKWKCGK